jgi:integrase
VSIRKIDDGKWLVNIKPLGRTGKQYKRRFDTQREAKEFVTWIQGQTQQDPEWKPTARDSRSLRVLIDLWYEHHGRELSAGKNTYSRLCSMCEALGNPEASALTTDDFIQYRTRRLEEGISKNTMNREHAYMRSVFNELKRMKYWKRENPLANIRCFKLQESELAYLTTRQIKTLMVSLKQSKNPHVTLIAKTCLATGARWSEAEGLSITQVKNGLIQYSKTKSKKVRAVPIDNGLETELHLHHKAQSRNLLIFGSAYSAFISAVERSSIELPKGQASHVLRHTFASHFIMNGGNILSLQRILGHASLQMTMRYAHLAPDHMQEVKKLNPLKRR